MTEQLKQVKYGDTIVHVDPKGYVRDPQTGAIDPDLFLGPTPYQTGVAPRPVIGSRYVEPQSTPTTPLSRALSALKQRRG